MDCIFPPGNGHQPTEGSGLPSLRYPPVIADTDTCRPGAAACRRSGSPPVVADTEAGRSGAAVCCLSDPPPPRQLRKQKPADRSSGLQDGLCPVHDHRAGKDSVHRFSIHQKITALIAESLSVIIKSSKEKHQRKQKKNVKENKRKSAKENKIIINNNHNQKQEGI